MFAEGVPTVSKCVACLQNIQERSVKVLVNRTCAILGGCYKCRLRVWWLLSGNKQGMSNGLTLPAERDLWKEIALVKGLFWFLLNYWCAPKCCGSQQAGCSAGRDLLGLGLHTSIERRAQSWHCTQALVSCGNSTWQEELAPQFHYSCLAEMPSHPDLQKKVGVHQVTHNY